MKRLACTGLLTSLILTSCTGPKISEPVAPPPPAPSAADVRFLSNSITMPNGEAGYRVTVENIGESPAFEVTIHGTGARKDLYGTNQYSFSMVISSRLDPGEVATNDRQWKTCNNSQCLYWSTGSYNRVTWID